MPHSSGGGSSDGGGHGGSGGSSSRLHTFTNFHGARRYAYYQDNGSLNYFYSNVDINSSHIQYRKKNFRFAVRMMIVLLTLVLLSNLGGNLYLPTKLSPICKNDNEIIDTLDCISSSEEQLLQKELLEFYDQTGISVTILTIPNTEWSGAFGSLERYAYDYYVKTFADEKHWLLVYSSKNNTSNQWAWEGMQGNDTDPVLTEKMTTKFNRIIQTNLFNMSVGNTFLEGFAYLNENIMIQYFDVRNFLFGLLAISLTFGAFFVIMIITMKRQIHTEEICFEVPNSETNPKILEEKCRYCDGIYIKGIHMQCPHCNATIELQNYSSKFQ